MRDLTLERLKELFIYDPNTGDFTRRARVSKVIAGTLRSDGYISIWIDRRQYLAHRLAWFYTVGEFPLEIDHIDGNKSNNRWSNLRSVTRSQNSANSINKNKRSEYPGVTLHGRKWKAQITVNYKRIHLGSFISRDEAHKAYITARLEYFGEYNPREFLTKEPFPDPSDVGI